jgi:tRNA modification GTPase
MVRDGLRVVIAGAPNVGKSSLVNALARRDVAIVSEQPGTTRDVVEVHLDLGGYAVILADTAGLRDSADAIERQGVDRARQRIDEADLVLVVRDASDSAAPHFDDAIDSRTIRLWNKVDIAAAAAGAGEGLRVSAKTGAGLDELIAVLAEQAEALLCGAESILVTRERHRAALAACVECLDRALATPDGHVELTAEDLRLAAGHLGRVTGRIGVEDLLDVIFADFCIGK